MTAQIPERLILSGIETTAMTFCPPLPLGHPALVERSATDPLRDEDRWFQSTACWRRYQATWEIRDGLFHLIEVRGRYHLTEKKGIVADWFSGVLRVPIGEPLQTVHMGFGHRYAWELHIKVNSGRVVGMRLFDSDGAEFDANEAALRNLPGLENNFAGDDW